MGNVHAHGATHWGEIRRWEHLVQFYPGEHAFLDTLEGFIAGGLRSGHSAVVIATPAHLSALRHRLDAGGIDVARATQRDQYIPLDAQETLDRFMVDGWPDERRFFALLDTLLARAGRGEWKVRAFGEMVALLWARGQRAATVELERLWHRACAERGLSLLCAYPDGFSKHEHEVESIRAAHSRVVTH